MARIGPYEVSEEKLRDIYAGKARLAAYKTTIETYPLWPGEPTLAFESEGQTSALTDDPGESMEHDTRLSRRIDKLSGALVATRDTLLDHIKARKIAKKTQAKGIEI